MRAANLCLFCGCFAIAAASAACGGDDDAPATTGDSATSDTATSDTAAPDSATTDTAITDTATSDTATTDTAASDTPDVPADTGDTAARFQCGTAPYTPFVVTLFAGGGATVPPFGRVRSNICATGTFLDIPIASPAGTGKDTIYLGDTAQFVTVTASDGSAFPAQTSEFTKLNATFLPGLPFTLYAKTTAFGLPPGFSAGSGKAYILVQLSKGSAAAPCDKDDGVTISVDGTAHPEAVVYYQPTGGAAWTTTGPSLPGKENVAIVLTPSSAVEYVQIKGTKPSCSVDTGITTSSNLRLIGFTGRIPISPDTITGAFASVAAP